MDRAEEIRGELRAIHDDLRNLSRRRRELMAELSQLLGAEHNAASDDADADIVGWFEPNPNDPRAELIDADEDDPTSPE